MSMYCDIPANTWIKVFQGRDYVDGQQVVRHHFRRFNSACRAVCLRMPSDNRYLRYMIFYISTDPSFSREYAKSNFDGAIPSELPDYADALTMVVDGVTYYYRPDGPLNVDYVYDGEYLLNIDIPVYQVSVPYGSETPYDTAVACTYGALSDNDYVLPQGVRFFNGDSAPITNTNCVDPSGFGLTGMHYRLFARSAIEYGRFYNALSGSFTREFMMGASDCRTVTLYAPSATGRLRACNVVLSREIHFDGEYTSTSNGDLVVESDFTLRPSINRDYKVTVDGVDYWGEVSSWIPNTESADENYYYNANIPVIAVDESVIQSVELALTAAVPYTFGEHADDTYTPIPGLKMFSAPYAPIVKKLYPENSIQDIADAIRSKNGLSDTYKVSQMASAIQDIPTGGSDDNFLIAVGAMSGSIYDNVLTSVVSYAFYGNVVLQGVEMIAVESISAYAFANCRSLTTMSFSMCGYIGAQAFARCSALTTVSFPACSYIGELAFSSCWSLTNANFPACTSVGASAFYRCSSLTSISFPICEYVDTQVFSDCSSLTIADFPMCSYIGPKAFNNCSALTTASFPVCSRIGGTTFTGCWTLSNIYFPICSIIETNAFAYCSALTEVSFPMCTSVGTFAFQRCEILTTVSFPLCSSIGLGAFSSCTSLTSISFPVCTNIGQQAFEGCRALTTVSFPACSFIGPSAFRSCYNLLSLYLLASSVASLSGTSVFYSTPISNYTASTGGAYGSIYVPASLVDAYKSATNWSVYSNRIVAYTE